MNRKTFTEVTSPKSRMSANSIMPAYKCYHIMGGGEKSIVVSNIRMKALTRHAETVSVNLFCGNLTNLFDTGGGMGYNTRTQVKTFA